MLQFESTELRVVEAEVSGQIQRVVPLVDVADAIGYDRQSVHEMVSRNTVLRENSVSVTLMQGDQHRHFLALTYEGVVGILSRITPDRIPDSEKRERVIRFQRWAFSALAKVLRGELVVSNPPYNQTAQIQELQAHVRRLEALLRESNPLLLPGSAPGPVIGKKRWTFSGILNILAALQVFPAFTVYDVMVEAGVKHKVAHTHMQAATLYGLVTLQVRQRADFPPYLANFTAASRCNVYQLSELGKAELQRWLDRVAPRKTASV